MTLLAVGGSGEEEDGGQAVGKRENQAGGRLQEAGKLLDKQTDKNRTSRQPESRQSGGLAGREKVGI